MADQVIIIGDGVAGLAMALAMAKANKRVTLIGAGAAPADRMLGGYQMAANGWSALRALGCDSEVWKHAKRLELMRIMTLAQNHTLVTIPLDEHHGRQPYASVTRRGLITSMATATSTMSQITYVKAEAKKIECHGEQVVVFDTDQNEHQADWVFGADGMAGLCRQYVDGGEIVKPKLTGRYAYRFLLPLERLPAVLSSSSTSVWLGPEGHIVHYPLTDGYLNLVIITHDGQHSWTSAQKLLNSHPWLNSDEINELSEDQALIMPLQSWPRCDSWIRGRVVVTGDSAHQMPPHLAQGTGQALIDAASLGHMLSDDKEMIDVIPAWAGQRMRSIRSVLASADKAGKVFSPPPVFSPVRDIMVGLGGMTIMPRILDKIWSDQL